MAFSQEKAPKKWNFAINPYLYLPTFQGKVRIPLPSDESRDFVIKVEPTNYLSNIKMAFMLSFEAEKNKFSILADYFYFRLGVESTTSKSYSFQVDNPIPILPPIDIGLDLNAGSVFDLKSSQYVLIGGYTLYDKKHTVKAFGGLRTLIATTGLDWQLNATVTDPVDLELSPSGSLSHTTNSWNGVVGFRGSLSLISSQKLRLNYYLDAGLGSSKFTWQGIAGLVYQVKSVGIELLYRHVTYNHGENSILDELTYTGLAIGASIKF